MSQPFVGEIRMFGFNFAPTGWAMCNGQLLPIAQNTALFSLLGTNYGGNGQSTFGLPNLPGRAPIHSGQGPGLTDRIIGETGGTPTVTLISGEMPVHNHSQGAYNATGNQSSPANHAGAMAKALRQSVNLYSSSNTATMNLAALPPVGSSLPHNNLPPFRALNFCIAMQGVYPSRN